MDEVVVHLSHGQAGGGDVGCSLAVGGGMDGVVVWALIAIGHCHGLFMSVNGGHGWLSLLSVHCVGACCFAVGGCSGWLSLYVNMGHGLSLSLCACHVSCSCCGCGSLLWVFVTVHVGGL